MRAFAPFALLAALAGPAVSQEVGVERFEFDVAEAFEKKARVSGELRIPAAKQERVPAVIILHGSAGIDGRGAFYAAALNEAGIATVEADLFQGRGRP